MILDLGIPRFQYPPCEGSESGRVRVVGGARCVWADIRNAPSGDTLCVNDVGMHFPGEVKHWYSNNDIWLPRWVAARRDTLLMKYGTDITTHSHQVGGMVTWPWPGAGTSALGAVYTALALGYDEVILCGVPLDDSGHYFDPPWVESNFIREVPYKGNGQLKYWRDAMKVFGGKVRSMSGRTRELLNQ